MAEAALGIYVVWAGLAFGARSILHNRQTGDSGLRLHADPMTLAWFAKIGFVLAAATGLGAPIAALAGSEDLSLLQSPAIQSAGVIAAVLGATATVWAQDTMGTSWRVGVDVGERTELVVNGPFTISRNPIFAA